MRTHNAATANLGGSPGNGDDKARCVGCAAPRALAAVGDEVGLGQLNTLGEIQTAEPRPSPRRAGHEPAAIGVPWADSINQRRSWRT